MSSWLMAASLAAQYGNESAHGRHRQTPWQQGSSGFKKSGPSQNWAIRKILELKQAGNEFTGRIFIYGSKSVS
jgi:hypothetical protein